MCDRHGALLILDEVMCGMGRTGTVHAWEAGGYGARHPGWWRRVWAAATSRSAAVLANARVVDPIRDGSGAFAHGHTYLAHPVACAAALAVQGVIRDDGLLEQVQARGALLEERLQDRFGNHRHVGDVRGRGLFRGVELVADRATKAPFDVGLRMNERVRDAAFARGLSIYPVAGTVDGVRGDHIVIAPPFIATEADIDMIVDRLGDAVDAAVVAA